jgi:phage tail-like protein
MPVETQDDTSTSCQSAGSGRGTTSDEARLGLACRFDVTVDGHDLGGWAECSDLSVKFDDYEVKELGNNGFVHRLPVMCTYTPIILKRAMTAGTWQNTLAWLAEVQRLPHHLTHGATITLNDAWGDTVAQWTLHGVYPLKWSAPSLSASDQKVAIETLELSHNGFLPETKDDREPVKARLSPNTGGPAVVFDYNPKKMSKRQSTQRKSTGSNQKGTGRSWSSTRIKAKNGGSGKDQPVSSQSAPNHDVGCSEYQMTDLVFDGDKVQSHVDQLFSWMEPTENQGKPPTLMFQWGDPDNYFTCTITQCKVDYLRFQADGRPIRASVDLTLTEVPKEEKRNNPTSGGPGGHRSRILALGESLASVAFEEYGEADLWRPLGRFNQIDDPIRLSPGTRLRIPTRTSLEKS